MAKRQTKEHVKETRSKRAKQTAEEATKANVPAQKARDLRNTANREAAEKRHEEEVEAMERETESKAKTVKAKAVVVGKPGSGAGLKPGDYFAPATNPGAAAMVPTQPLQPESKQSHGKGILYDKDLDNPPYDVGDPLKTDEGPSGTGSPSNTGDGKGVDKAAERKKAERATPRSKQLDPDNPTRGRTGRDATASPKPIGTHGRSKADVPGGSNSGVDRDER